MLKAGLLPSPTITPLTNSVSSKNKIDSQTFIELRSEVPNVRIFFTVDGTKPDPFQTFKTGRISTFVYKGAFRLGPGRRVVKVVAVSTDGLRESNVTTKYVDVNDMYSENNYDFEPDEFEENGNDSFDNQKSYMDRSPERTSPSPQRKKSGQNQRRTNSDSKRKNNLVSMSHSDVGDGRNEPNNHIRTAWDDAFNVQGSVEGPISPVNYAGTQVNIWGIPPGGQFSDELLHMADPSRNSQYGYMTEKMLERLQQPQYLPITAQPPPPKITDVTQDESERDNFWDRKPKPFSMGDGNWKKTLEHIFLNIYNYVKDEQELRELFGWKKFGRIESARLIDKGNTYQMMMNFKKPLGESTQQPTSQSQNRKPSTRRPIKRVRTPLEEEKPIRQPERRPQPITPPQTPPRFQSPPRSQSPPVEQHNDSMRDDHQPRIYTEETVQQGTLVPFQNFNAEQDCEALRKAMKGLGTNESMLIHILGNRSVEQRLKIKDTYKTMFGRDLIEDLESETSGNFRKVLKRLLLSPVEFDCHELRRAVKGAGTDEEALIEILTSRSNKRIQSIADMYPKLYGRSLEKDIVGDTSGQFKKILVALLQGSRPDSNEINEDDVQNDARSLYEAGEKKWGTDESTFIQILCNRSDVQLRAVFDAYSQFSKKDIEAAIKSETSGSLCKSLLAIVRVMRNRPGYFAYQLKKALKGVGTDEEDLNRIIISRCEVDMVQIKEEYSNIGKRTLENHIQSDTSGDYRKLLLELLKDPSQRTANIGDAGKNENLELPGYEQPLIYKEEIIQQGTMVPAPNFDANRDAEALRKAMKGLGTDEKSIINILGNRVTAQRVQIKDAFKSKFGRDLTKDLISETSGNFKKLLERLTMDAVELDCFELKQAVKGAGTDEETLIEILASRSNERIKAINNLYTKRSNLFQSVIVLVFFIVYGKSLEKDVSSDTSGNFRRLLVSLMQANRPETTDVNIEQAKQDAQALVDAGEQKFGTDESRFNVLFCNRSDSQFRAIINEFTKLTGKTIEESVKSETSGDLSKGLLAIIRCIRSRPHFFAEQIRKAMKGLGTKESVLNRIIITRSEIDLVQIKAAFNRLFSRELERDVSAETSGDYKTLLLEILKDPGIIYATFVLLVFFVFGTYQASLDFKRNVNDDRVPTARIEPVTMTALASILAPIALNFFTGVLGSLFNKPNDVEERVVYGRPMQVKLCGAENCLQLLDRDSGYTTVGKGDNMQHALGDAMQAMFNYLLQRNLLSLHDLCREHIHFPHPDQENCPGVEVNTCELSKPIIAEQSYLLAPCMDQHGAKYCKQMQSHCTDSMYSTFMLDNCYKTCTNNCYKPPPLPCAVSYKR
ncbi:unnamed protein product [Didymodactylos carnosus]|uniref:Annexin n=1 Tax=Didymodactylos carnosus TaxID=1234261 RepID=A0A8S2CUM8_9BILA|nr:unnamed protein product [Didymodactylos carnosus]CAF3552203.1 unnamed protein product [Didymodactylos carnosus]